MKYRKTGILIGADRAGYPLNANCDEYYFETNITDEFIFMLGNRRSDDVIRVRDDVYWIGDCAVYICGNMDTSVYIYNPNERKRENVAKFLDGLVKEVSDG